MWKAAVWWFYAMQPEPRATYRLQLRPGFGFEQAIDVIDYLADLGVSHLYTSPYLQASLNSTHGYDVVDPSKVNAQLGNDESHRKLCETLQAAGLGQMIDIVPNHMAILGKQNPWWWDVLENGPSSHFSIYFDIDWSASEERWPNKVLLPLLSDHYGRILENGQLKLSFQNGFFVLHYQDYTFPIDPSSLSGFLRKVANSCNSELLAFLAESYARLPRPTVTSRQAIDRRHHDKAVLFDLMVRLCNDEPETKTAIIAEVERLNHNVDALDEFINLQNYRLAFWRIASRDLGYRRFFDIKDLVGLRIEDPEVFRATHVLPIAWFLKGWVQGLRVDHPDGLRNPEEYFNRLQEVCPGAWIIAEKILEPGEKLPQNWQVAGTTGYDFLNLLNGLFIDPTGKKALTDFYRNIIGEKADFDYLVHHCKLLVLRELFGSEVNRLSSLFVDICERHRRQRDYSKSELHEAICQTAACFPVYRSYVSAADGLVRKEDEAYVNTAINQAIKESPELEVELFHFLKELLLLRIPGELEGDFAMRFQQLTGPVMAKGFEDTALYRYQRLIALNEVGSDPGCFGISLSQFHEACQAAQKEHPLSLLASTTHDTKRSEDFRSRLALLSEIPEEFCTVAQRWMDINKRHLNEDLPDRNTEYLLYQTLVGAWPISQERVLTYMEKAVREAKEHTSWNKPNKDYETRLHHFVQAIMQDETFKSDLESFIARLVHPGRINSLAQTLIKLTAPGIPDIYQGSELWDLTLVDPDNRQIVDFALRRQMLAEIKNLSPEQILTKMEEGLPKLWLIWKTLLLRKHHPEFFSPKSPYRPLYAQGKNSDHVVAFMRGESVVSLTPRFILRLKNDWKDTSLELPKGSWLNSLTGDKVIGGRLIPIQELLHRFPVGLLKSEQKNG